MYKRLSIIASAVIWVLLPKCSACLLAYLSLFSALGLGHLVNNAFTIPVIHSVLVFNFSLTVYFAVKEKQYLYALTGFLSTLIFIVNKLYFDSVIVNYLTASILLAAILSIRLLRIYNRQCAFEQKQ